MASLAEPRCTCPSSWRGRGQRPWCVVHEADGHPADELPAGHARRTDGLVVDVMATIGGPSPGPERDLEGQGAARSWRAWP